MQHNQTITPLRQRVLAAPRGRAASALAVSLSALACALAPGRALANGGVAWNHRFVAPCTLGAGITYDQTNNRYYIAGYMACGSTTTLRRMVCNPVHRHSFYWDSHPTLISYSSSRDFNQASGWTAGTNGASYKTHCHYYLGGRDLGILESPVITL